MFSRGGGISILTLLAQESNLQDIHKIDVNSVSQTTIKLEDSEVSRENIPIIEGKYPIQTPIPKTAYHLPLLQSLFHIKEGTLPNPLGVSLIGGYMIDTYRVSKFKGQMGESIGEKLGGILDGIPEKIGSIYLFNNAQFKGVLFNQTREAFLSNIQQQLNNAFNTDTTDWKLTDGESSSITSAIGAKFDLYLLPFLNLFVTATYIHVEQETRVGSATIPLNQPITLNLDGIIFGNNKVPITIDKISFPIGTMKNTLDGYALMGGTNLSVGYKGFFASCMLSVGYVELSDWKNNIDEFVKKPFMYIAPRVGYTYAGVVTLHIGVQRIELFGSTKGNDLSALSGGLVQSYLAEVEKFPINFLAGMQFMPMRDFGISFEYVGSPDTSGVNAEISYRF